MKTTRVLTLPLCLYLIAASVTFVVAQEVKPIRKAQLLKPAKPSVGETKETKKTKKATLTRLGTPKVKVARIDRAKEVERLINNYQGMAVRYSDAILQATTDDAKAKAERYRPTLGAFKRYARLLSEIVATDPTDEPALDALVFLSKFIGVEEVKDYVKISVGDDSPSSIPELLLKHHTHNPKLVEAMRRIPLGETADAFLRSAFEKSLNPDVRWLSGAQLVASLRRNDRSSEIEPIAIAMSEDRYLAGVNVGRTNARDWAIAKLREIRTLGIGNVLPEVEGNKLTGGTGHISDYRGKVVVLDVWTTWCGPCVRMIPEQVKLAEEFGDEPFAFLSVSCDRNQEVLEKFLDEHEMPWDHWWVGMESSFVKTLNISSFPSIYLLDSKGVIRRKGLREEELRQAIESLLKEEKQRQEK